MFKQNFEKIEYKRIELTFAKKLKLFHLIMKCIILNKNFNFQLFKTLSRNI